MSVMAADGAMESGCCRRRFSNPMTGSAAQCVEEFAAGFASLPRRAVWCPHPHSASPTCKPVVHLGVAGQSFLLRSAHLRQRKQRLRGCRLEATETRVQGRRWVCGCSEGSGQTGSRITTAARTAPCVHPPPARSMRCCPCCYCICMRRCMPKRFRSASARDRGGRGGGEGGGAGEVLVVSVLAVRVRSGE